MPKERAPGGFEPGREPPVGPELPEVLAEFLRSQEVACLLHPTNEGTVFVVKAPSRDIKGMSPRFPVSLRHELYQHPAAPVIRTLLTIYDRPGNPLKLETFTNVEQEDQRSDFAALAKQEEIAVLFYDDQVVYRRGIRIRNPDPGSIEPIVEQADQVYAAIPRDRFDFDRAKAEVMRATRL